MPRTTASALGITPAAAAAMFDLPYQVRCVTVAGSDGITVAGFETFEEARSLARHFNSALCATDNGAHRLPFYFATVAKQRSAAGAAGFSCEDLLREPTRDRQGQLLVDARRREEDAVGTIPMFRFDRRQGRRGLRGVGRVVCG